MKMPLLKLRLVGLLRIAGADGRLVANACAVREMSPVAVLVAAAAAVSTVDDMTAVYYLLL